MENRLVVFHTLNVWIVLQYCLHSPVIQGVAASAKIVLLVEVLLVLLLGHCQELGRLLRLHLDPVSERLIGLILSSLCFNGVLWIEETRRP